MDIKYKETENKSKWLLSKMLSEQKKSHSTFGSNSEATLNLLLMYANNLFSVKSKDIEFSLIENIINTKRVWNKLNTKYDEFIQTLTMNNKYIGLFIILIKKYSELNIDKMDENEMHHEMVELTNIKMNLQNDGQEFFEQTILPFVNIIIFSKFKQIDLLQTNLTILNNSFDTLFEKSNKTDYVFITKYVFTILKEKGILN